LICTTSRQIPSSASANQGPAKGDLFPALRAGWPLPLELGRGTIAKARFFRNGSIVSGGGMLPTISEFHFETLIIYQLGSVKFTTQNDLHQE
jgi:hypothetical protein